MGAVCAELYQFRSHADGDLLRRDCPDGESDGGMKLIYSAFRDAVFLQNLFERRHFCSAAQHPNITGGCFECLAQAVFVIFMRPSADDDIRLFVDCDFFKRFIKGRAEDFFSKREPFGSGIKFSVIHNGDIEIQRG